MQHPLFIYWNPSPDVFSFGTFAIKWYGLMWGLSLIFSFMIEEYVFKILKRDEEKLTLAIQYTFIFGLLGARLAHIIFYQFDYYSTHPLEVFFVWKGGLASHGGVVGSFLGLYIFCLRNKDYTYLWCLDIGVIPIPLLGALIRFGNLMNSEIVGKVTNFKYAFIFEQVDALPRHAVVLYESIYYLLLQGIMLLLFKKYKESKPGVYLVAFMLGIFGIRFFIEFFKEPDGQIFFGVISKTQMLNIPIIVTGFVLMYFVSKNKLKYKTPNA
jgi:prolipoprotein diacylglyceryl transferase